MSRWGTGRGAIAVVAAALALAVACGESPAEGYRAIASMAARGDWGGVYDRVDKRSQGRLEASLARHAGPAGEGPRERFARVARIEDHLAARFPTDYEITGSAAAGDEATLRVRVRRAGAAAAEESVRLVREDGIWKVTVEAVEPPAPPPAEDPADRHRAVECGRLLDVIDRGREAVRARGAGADPIETLGSMARALDLSATEAGRLELATPELSSLARDYHALCRDVAQAARDMASASRGGDSRRKDAAAEAYAAAAEREKPLLDAVRRACRP